jgi:hypothetical protein
VSDGGVPLCEVCGAPAASPLDFLFWPSTPERPEGDGVRHAVHPDCTEALAERLRTEHRGLCLWCEEPVLAGERAEQTVFLTRAGPEEVWRHWECAARAALGSVAHQERGCSCHGGPGEDDPALTRREAARAALEAGRRRFVTTWVPDPVSRRTRKP